MSRNYASGGPQMSETKRNILIISTVFLVGLAVGRFTVPTKTVTVKELVEVEKEKKDSDIDAQLNRHTETTTVEKVEPDGTKETTTKKIEDLSKDKKTESKIVIQDNKDQLDKKEVTKDKGKVSISALAGYHLNNPTGPGALVYGAHVTTPVLGPFLIGVFGFTDGMVGASLGLQF